MKVWDLRIKSNPQTVIKKLDSALGSVDGFVFNTDRDQRDAVTFRFRKRVLYPDQILHRNRIIVNGKALSTDVENETKLQISFAQHIATTVTTYLFIGSGLIALVLAIGRSASTYIPGALMLAVGLVFWIGLRGKFERDIQSYKTLIADILEHKTDSR